MESGLVKITEFVSPVYQAKFKSFTEQDEDRPGRIHYNEVPEDGIINWLNENSLSQTRDSIPGRYVGGDTGYMMVSNDRTISIIYPSFRDAEKHEKPENLSEDQKSDRFFIRKLTIRSQPSTGNIPEALVQELESENYRNITD